jgi:hypothetical protein
MPTSGEPSLELEKLLKKLSLDVLHLEESLPLMAHQLVEFSREVANLKLRFQVDKIILLRPTAIFCLLTILTHHNNGRLHRSDTREKKVEENEWIRIE